MARTAKAGQATTIAAEMTPPTSKPDPEPGSAWARIERARQALEWNERKMGTEALGNPSHYTKIWAGGWKSKTETQDKVIARLVEEGFSEAWLRLGTLPERADGPALPLATKLSTQLKQLARRLGLPAEQIFTLWADLEGAGPLEKLPNEVQRAAFAAAYIEGRTFEDVAAAAREVMRSKPGTKGVESWLSEIRFALRAIKVGSGTLPSVVVPLKKTDRF